MTWRLPGSTLGLVLLPLLAVVMGGPVLIAEALGAYGGPAPWSESYMLDPALDPCSRPSWLDSGGEASNTVLGAVELFYAIADPGIAGYVVSVEVLPGGWLSVAISDNAPWDVVSRVVAYAAEAADRASLQGAQVIVVDEVESKAVTGGMPELVEPDGETGEARNGDVARAIISGAPMGGRVKLVGELGGTCRQALVTVEEALSTTDTAPVPGVLERNVSERLEGEASQHGVSPSLMLGVVGGVTALAYCFVRRCRAAGRRAPPWP